MYKSHKFLIMLTFLIVFFCVKFLLRVEITESVIQGCITMLSITFGFYMTSISVLYSSEYLKTFNEVDPKKKNQRKVHTLVAYFKGATYCSLTSIFFILGCSVIFKANNNILMINVWVKSILLALIAINAIFMLLLFKILIQGLVHQSKAD